MQSYQLDCHLAKGDSIPQPDLSTDEVSWVIAEVKVICWAWYKDRGPCRHIEAESMREYNILHQINCRGYGYCYGRTMATAMGVLRLRLQAYYG